MNILESIYEIDFPKINFLERKISIQNPNTILLGPPKSGKTYLIYDYLRNFDKKEVLYIDWADLKNDHSKIVSELDYFIETHSIQVLVLENFSFKIPLPNVTNIIISTTQKIPLSYQERFEELYVPTLDFEEYLLFDTKHNSTATSFNSFLKFGSFPEILEYQEYKKPQRNLEICKLYTDDPTTLEILFICIKFAGEKKSVFQLFNTLKKEIKISKDKFYKVYEQLSHQKIILECEKYLQPKAVKKLYIFNHGLLDIVSYKKNFNNLFKNMVYLELIRRDESVYHLDFIDFYLPQTKQIVLAIPFFNSLVSASIISKILPAIQEYEIRSVTIVTISTEQTIFIDEIEANILPFYNWVLSL